MNVFEFFVKMTHPKKKPGWVETTAYFTGDVRKFYDRVRKSTAQTIHVTADADDYKEYAIKYNVGDTQRTGWYRFYPPVDPEEVKGRQIKIRYKKSRPWLIENISEADDDDYDYDER